MSDINLQTLAGLVSEDHRTAAVLEKYALDFCCKGKRTLQEACEEKGLDLNTVSRELEEIAVADSAPRPPFGRMDASQLIAHIMLRHHFYVKQALPRIFEHLQKVVQKHGERFPYMQEVFWLFARLQTDLGAHLDNEEEVLFPAIRSAEEANRKGAAVSPSAAAIIRGTLAVMASDHEDAGVAVSSIRQLTNDYASPTGACSTFRLVLSELRDFEQDLHRHVHLENNRLFPLALQMAS